MNERTIFLNALEIADPAEREAYLDQACGADTALRQNVAALVKSHAEASGFLQKPAVEQMATSAFLPPPETPRSATDLMSDQRRAATPNQDETQAEPSQATDQDLTFLAPSTKPGNIGRLGHYEILGVIGKGGFGVVLRGFDERLHRVVAIKVLATNYAAVGSARKRFIREARAAAAVKSEHVVGIHDIQGEANPPYLVMECIDGVSLQDKIDKHGALDLREILRIGMQMAEGLAAAHKQGLVHRDIKPANILLENGVERVKITDFGLARAVDDASVTQSGTVAGTPMYMSPEQAEGGAIDHRSDLFSLGTVLYAMCTGHPPFRASGTHAVLKRVIDATTRPIREINIDIPDWLCAIIAKLHAKVPDDRFQTAKEVAELLGQRLADVQAGRAIDSGARRGSPDPAGELDRRSPESAGDLRSDVSAGSGDPRRARVQPSGSLHSPKSGSWLWRPSAFLALLVACIATTGIVGLVGAWLLGYFHAPDDTSTLAFENKLNPNVHSIVIKQDSQQVAVLNFINDFRAQLRPGIYHLEVTCDQGFEVTKIGLDKCQRIHGGQGSSELVKPLVLRLNAGEVVYLGIGVAKTASNPAEDPEWVQLFNGKDLNGWIAPPPGQGKGDWQVDTKLGQLVGRGAVASCVITERDDFADFHLKTEVSCTGGTESGIYFRCGKELGPDAVLPGLQVATGYAQGINTGAFLLTTPGSLKTLTLFNPKSGAAAATFHPLEIIARGPQITIKIDGKVVTDYKAEPSAYTRGRIALRVYSPKGDGAVVFKKIEIKELPPEAPGWVQLFNGNNVDAWTMAPPDSWKQEGSVLTGRDRAHLWSRKSYRDVHCRAEVMIDSDTAGMLAVRHGGAPSGAGVNLGSFSEKRKTGSLFQSDEAGNTTVHVYSALDVKPKTWFVVEAVVRGNELRVLIDGKETARKTLGDLPSDGRVGLGLVKGTLTLRKFEIKELPSEEFGWVHLFNGKDLKAWDVSDSAKWTIKDEVLVGASRAFLFSKGRYGDFHLRATMRSNAPGIASISFRAKDGSHGEMGVGDNRHTISLGRYAQGKTTELAAAKTEMLPPNTWCDVDLIVRGQKATVKINGVLAIETVIDGLPPTGQINLNAYEGGSPIEFKKIEIKNLAPAETGWVKLFNGEDAKGWTMTPAASWTIENGALANRANAHLWTGKKDYRDVHLRVEFKAESNAFGLAGVRRKGKAAVAGVTLGDAGGKRNDGSLFQNDEAGKSTIHVNSTADLKPDTWAVAEVIIRGSVMTVFVNGKETGRHVFSDLPSDGAVGVGVVIGKIQFRNIEIKELPPAPELFVAAAVDLADVLKKQLKNSGSKYVGLGEFDRMPPEFRKALEKELTVRGIKSVPAGGVRLRDELRITGKLDDYRAPGNATPVEFRYLIKGALGGGNGSVSLKNVPLRRTPDPDSATAPFSAAKARIHQDAWARHFGVDAEITNAIGMKLRLIPAGRFTMGSSKEEVEKHIPADAAQWVKTALLSEVPEREVVIDRPFYLGVHEVTVGQFRKFVKDTGYRTTAEKTGNGIAWDAKLNKGTAHPDHVWSNARFAKTDQHPVLLVTQLDAEAFCAWLSKKDGRRYVLPREDQWEFACRAGTTTGWWTGNTFDDLVAKEAVQKATMEPVGALSPNPFGLFDMHGNAAELCLDADGVGVSRGTKGILAFTRSAARQVIKDKDDAWFQRGFRVAVAGDLAALAPEAPGGALTITNRHASATAAVNVFRIDSKKGAWNLHDGVFLDPGQQWPLKLEPGEYEIKVEGPAGKNPPDVIERVKIEDDKSATFEFWAPPGQGWESLFNGTNLDGWNIQNKKDGRWFVDMGVLKGTAKGDKSYHLFGVHSDYADFHLRAKTLVGAGGKAFLYTRILDGATWKGVGLRLHHLTARDMEVSLFSTLNPVRMLATKRRTLGPGTWFDLDIIAKRHHYEVKIDGISAITHMFSPEDGAKHHDNGAIVLEVPDPYSTLSISTMEIKEFPRTYSTIYGNVTQRGVPIPAGTVTFHFANKQTLATKVADGKYVIDIPANLLGNTKLTVDMPPPAAGSSLKMLAARYRDPEKSGLTIRAVLAKQNYNLDLTDVE